MALAVRASASAKVVSTRRVQPRAARVSVRAAAFNTNQIAASVATVATAAFAAAPAEAHNVVMTLADQPYAGAWLSTVLVPLTGLLFPGMAMASLFLYISKNKA